MYRKNPKARPAATCVSIDVEKYLTLLARVVVLTLPQASRYTGLHTNTLRKAIERGDLKVYMYQSQMVVMVRDLRHLKRTGGPANS